MSKRRIDAKESLDLGSSLKEYLPLLAQLRRFNEDDPRILGQIGDEMCVVDRTLLPKCRHGYLLNGILRALRPRREPADAVDDITKELDTHGVVRVGRVHIQNAAATT